MHSSRINEYKKRLIPEIVIFSNSSLSNLSKASMRRLKFLHLLTSVKSGQTIPTSNLFMFGNVSLMYLIASGVSAPKMSSDSTQSCGLCSEERHEITPNRLFDRRQRSFSMGTVSEDHSFSMVNTPTSMTVRMVRSGIFGRENLSSWQDKNFDIHISNKFETKFLKKMYNPLTAP